MFLKSRIEGYPGREEDAIMRDTQGSLHQLAASGVPDMERLIATCLRVVTAGVLVLSLTPATAAGRDQPNIMLVLLDNTGWGDFGPYGGGALRGAPSPNVDRLAAEGLMLQNFNTEPQCTPSRSALMTGRYAIRSGNQSVPVGLPYYGLVPWEVTIAESLSEAGYATGIFGKWHLGKTPGRFPTDQGFDEWYGIANSTDDVFWQSPDDIRMLASAAQMEASVPENELPWVLEGRRGESPRRLRPYNLDERRRIDRDLVERAIAFMRQRHEAGKPFFAYLPLTAMHYPSLPHPDFAGKSGTGMYADMLLQTDHYLGLLLDAIDQLGIADDTLVIFTADNGPEDPVNGDGHFSGWTGPWAGTYFTAMEGGLRVPFIARWPGTIDGGRISNEIVHLVDLMPTLAAFAGAPMPGDRAIDGVDMSPFFIGKRSESGRQGFPVFVGDDLYAVKWRNWKIHFIWQPSKYSAKALYSTVPKIVNLLNDPREARQVAEPFNTWIQYAATPVLGAYQQSLARYPNVPVGAGDDYAP